jgi:lipid-A-disaccharide synthase
VRRRFAQALCIFPFEEKFYRDAGVAVEFIGHPLVGNVKANLSRAEFCTENGLNVDKPIVTILPGSRRGEIEYHGAILAQGLAQLRLAIPEVQAVVAVAPGVNRTELEACFGSGNEVRFVTGATYDALATADLAIVSSGTATVEAALLGKPMIVIYRLSPLSAKLAKPLVRTEFFSMVNLIAGREVVPELIQDDFTPIRVASEAISLLSASKESLEKLATMRRGLAEVTRLLGPPRAVERAADAIVGQLRLAQSNAK